MAVYYVSKWVEAFSAPKSDAKIVIKFLKNNIFARFVFLGVINDVGHIFAMHNC